jgi:adenylate cyclase
LAREQRRLAAIVAADVVGYSRLMGRDESGTLVRLRKNRAERLNPVLAKYGGRLVKLTGDGALVEFASAVDALNAAIEFQQAMVEANRDQPADTALVFRMGLHVGDVIVDGDDLYGDSVNIAARLEAEAPPGGIIVSRAVREAVERRVKAKLHALGELALKNIARPIRAFRVEWEAADWPSVTDAPEQQADPAMRSTRPLPLPDKPSIAVLPFQNMSGDPEQEYFTDGMVEEIITALSRFKELFVIARNSSFTYKGKAVNVKQVGRELGVRYVLKGSVRKAANRVRITGQLIDASTGGHLWADHFDGSLEDVFELQDRVTSSVIGAIGPKLEQAEIERAKRKPTESLDAYDYFLRAMARCHLFARDSLLEARQLFHRATELDASYAAPYGMAVWCVCICKLNGWLADPEREITEGVRLARHAAAIGKDDPTALWPSGMGLAYLAGEIETGVAYADRAIVLNPNLAQAWGTSGWMRTYLGEPAEAIERFERAMRLSPLDPLASQTYSGIALAHLYAGRYDEAASWARKAMLEQPDSAMPARLAAIAYALSDRMVEAREAMARVRVIDPALRLSNLERVWGPLRRAEDRARYIEGLRRAGLPE